MTRLGVGKGVRVGYGGGVSEGTTQIESSWAAVRDHTRHFTDFTFVYPVISRRSRGLSIGVNLNPDKVCNFDCIYCEVDRRLPGAVTEVDLRQMQDELAAMVRFAKDGGLAKEPKFDEVPWLTRDVKDIAFSGDGEPTMIKNFTECVQTVVEVQQLEGLDETKIVLITDAAGLDKADVKRGMEIMDAHNGEVWGKLDAGTEEYFKLVNRSNVKFERILKNLEEAARGRPIANPRPAGKISPAARCARRSGRPLASSGSALFRDTRRRVKHSAAPDGTGSYGNGRRSTGIQSLRRYSNSEHIGAPPPIRSQHAGRQERKAPLSYLP